MANYISREILCEAYTHLDIELFEDKVRLEELRNELAAFFTERASFLFGSDVEIRVEFEHGSLKTRIIAIGSAAAVIGGIVSSYGSFRESIAQLADDAVALAQSANIEVIFRTRTPYCDRLRVEKRKGVFGRVSALLGELDSLAAQIETSKLPTNEKKLEEVGGLTDTLLEWDSRVDKLLSKFDSPETNSCVANGLLTEIKNLPRTFPWEDQVLDDSFRSEIANSDPRLASQIGGETGRYVAAIRSISKKLADRVAQSSSVAGG